MSTTAHPLRGRPRGRTPGVLVVSAVSVVATVVVVVLAAGLASGQPGAYGALVGGAIAFGFFVFGSAVVMLATRIVPQAALMMAVLTYTLQVSAVALVFSVLSRSGAMDGALSPGWLAVGVIAATVAWSLAQMVATARTRILVYDIDLPGQHTLPSPGTPPQAVEPVSAPASQRQERGAP